MTKCGRRKGGTFSNVHDVCEYVGLRFFSELCYGTAGAPESTLKRKYSTKERYANQSLMMCRAGSCIQAAGMTVTPLLHLDNSRQVSRALHECVYAPPHRYCKPVVSTDCASIGSTSPSPPSPLPYSALPPQARKGRWPQHPSTRKPSRCYILYDTAVRLSSKTRTLLRCRLYCRS